MTKYIAAIYSVLFSAAIANSQSASYLDSLPAPIGIVTDLEDLFSPKEEAALESLINSYSTKTQTQVAIVTLDADQVPFALFDDLTLLLARKWGVGIKGINRGILIGISNGHKRFRMQNSNEIVKLIPNDEAESIMHTHFFPEFRNGNFYQGTYNGVDMLLEAIHVRLKNNNAYYDRSKYMVMDSAQGDLNQDSFADKILVLQSKTTDSINGNERLVFILFGTGDGQYILNSFHDSAAMCSRCGGAFGDPYEGISIRPGYFTLHHRGGATKRWNRNTTFKYSTKTNKWILSDDSGIKYDNTDPEKSMERYRNEYKTLDPIQFEKFNYVVK